MKTLFTCLVAVMALSVGLMARAEPLPYTKVIGTEFPGEYKHPASFTELDNGDLYLSYYGGGGEYESNSKVWAMRKKRGSKKWSEPEIIADTPFRGEGNPVVWQAPDGVLWLYYNQQYGDTWSETRIKGKVSNDRGKTWSDSFMVIDTTQKSFEAGMMVRARPIVLNNGDYLLGIYHETGFDRENVGADTTSLFLRYNPKTHEWKESNRIYSRMGNLQPSPVQITDDYLVSYSRRGGGYDEIPDGYLVRSESRDGGYTWSRGTDSQFPNPNSATDFIKLQNGNLLLVYNDSMHRRTPLTVAVSTDNDESYPHRRHIAEGRNSFAYPVVLQGQDGTIHIICTTNGRSTILHFEFDEKEILGHTLEGSGK
jgi:predicted neuraminidase